MAEDDEPVTYSKSSDAGRTDTAVVRGVASRQLVSTQIEYLSENLTRVPGAWTVRPDILARRRCHVNC